MVFVSEEDDLKLEPGDLLLYKNTALWAWPIRWATASAYTHAEIYAGELLGVPMQVGAVYPKVQARQLDPTNVGCEVYRVAGFTPDRRAKIAAYGLRKLGVTYSLGQIIIDFWRIKFSKPSKPTDKFLDEMVCSELVAYALHDELGITIAKSPDMAMPIEIVESPHTFKVGEVRPRL